MVVSLTQLFNYKSISNQEISSTNLDKDNVEEKKNFIDVSLLCKLLKSFFNNIGNLILLPSFNRCDRYWIIVYMLKDRRLFNNIYAYMFYGML